MRTVKTNQKHTTLTGERTELICLIAEPGKLLTRDGVKAYPIIHTDSEEGWREIDAPEPEAAEKEPLSFLKNLLKSRQG